MYKIIKYLHESGKIFFSIAGIIVISIITLLTTNFVINEFATKPSTRQAVVVAKYEKDNFSISNPLSDNKTYNIIVKDENNKLYNLTTSEREYKYIEEKELYVLQIKNDRLLYVINTIQKQFIVLNKLKLANIEITDEDLNKAYAFMGDSSIDKVAKEEPVVKDEPKENPPLETETPLEENPSDSNEPIDEEPIEEPIEEEPIVVETPVEEPITNEPTNTEQNNGLPTELFLTSSSYSITAESNKAIVESTSSSNYATTIVVNGKETSCTNVTPELGKCMKIDTKTVWTLDGLSSGTNFEIKVYSDEITSDFDINFY